MGANPQTPLLARLEFDTVADDSYHSLKLTFGFEIGYLLSIANYGDSGAWPHGNRTTAEPSIDPHVLLYDGIFPHTLMWSTTTHPALRLI